MTELTVGPTAKTTHLPCTSGLTDELKRMTMTATTSVLVCCSVLLWANSGWIHAKAVLAQILIESAWQSSVLRGKPVQPWPWADTWPVAKMAMPGRDQSLLVLAGASGSSLAFGPGLVDGTDLPGYGRTAVIAAHRDTHFSFLATVQPGEHIDIQRRDGRWQGFEVSDSEIVDTSQSDALWYDPTLDQIILVTCYPFDAIDPGGPLRLIVRLTPRASNRGQAAKVTTT